jgi:hypothetical protein
MSSTNTDPTLCGVVKVASSKAKGEISMASVTKRLQFHVSMERALSFVCLGGLLAFAVSIGSAGAQDATPTAGSPYDPANCTTEPISTDHVSMLLATPVPSPVPPVTEHGIVSLPSGVPADDATVAAVTEVIHQLWACNNARNKAALYNNFTDQAIQETIGFTEGTSWDTAELRADVAAALTPGEPRTAEEWAAIDALVSATAYDDGQVGVLLLNTDPLVANGDQVLDYFRFVLVDGAYKVSAVTLDPYDLTPDYGFEKAA